MSGFHNCGKANRIFGRTVELLTLKRSFFYPPGLHEYFEANRHKMQCGKEAAKPLQFLPNMIE